MYSKLPNLVFGFHGCDSSVFNKIIRENQKLHKSQNEYDWLGHGIYFWEFNPQRAYEFAESLKTKGKIKELAVIGAIIDLGYCLDFVNSKYIPLLKVGYDLLTAECKNASRELPKNKLMEKGIPMLRNLDCAVIQRIHQWNVDNDYQEYDSVRGVFFEGDNIYPSSGFKEKNHIQICIRNTNCIKGYFNPLEPDEHYSIP